MTAYEMRISELNSDVCSYDLEHSVVNRVRFHESDIAIVFGATRESVQRLHASLIKRGFDAVALSGEHSQNERNHAMQALRDRRARVCVATDVAARGIDLPDLRLVIHADIPRDAETLQHRSGRRSEEHTSELQSLMRISYAVFCLKKKNNHKYIIKL